MDFVRGVNSSTDYESAMISSDLALNLVTSGYYVWLTHSIRSIDTGANFAFGPKSVFTNVNTVLMLRKNQFRYFGGNSAALIIIATSWKPRSNRPLSSPQIIAFELETLVKVRLPINQLWEVRTRLLISHRYICSRQFISTCTCILTATMRYHRAPIWGHCCSLDWQSIFPIFPAEKLHRYGWIPVEEFHLGFFFPLPLSAHTWIKSSQR